MKQLGSENWVRVAHTHTGQAGRQPAIQCGMQMLQVQVNKDGPTKEGRESERWERQRVKEREGPHSCVGGASCNCCCCWHCCMGQRLAQTFVHLMRLTMCVISVKCCSGKVCYRNCTTNWAKQLPGLLCVCACCVCVCCARVKWSPIYLRVWAEAKLLGIKMAN